jgi:hypothetical protein
MEFVSITLNVVLVASMAWFAPGGHDRSCPLVVELKAPDFHEIRNGIALSVQITNNSDSDFALNTTAKAPVFTLQVVNEQGVDLNKDQLRGVSKDRTNKATAPLVFKPHQTITYKVRLTKYVGEDGSEKRIPSGRYQISALVPVVSYEGTSSRVELLDSKPVTVTLK